MKLRGKWVTVNSVTRFVRDPDPVKPAKARKPRKEQPQVIRAHDLPRRKLPVTRMPELREKIDWSTEPSCLQRSHVERHERLLERRAAGDYDHPEPSAYAIALLNRNGGTGDLAINPLPWGCRMKGFTTAREDGSFTSFYLLGSATAAGNPRRPCDRTGI